MTTVVRPGEWLGLLGGGQLGRMFTAAAQRLGYRVIVLDPDEHSPAGCVADAHLCADYRDPSALRSLAERARAVTTEFENVPAASLEALAEHCKVAPASSVVAVAQDRRREKSFVGELGIAVTPYAEIASAEDASHADEALFPGLLKSARLGYDGKGQIAVQGRSEARAAFERLGGEPCVLERRLELDRELSVVFARTADGEAVCFPCAENSHRDGILDVSLIPARISTDLAARARAAALRIGEALGVVGVMCVEFFQTTDGKLYVNELAPRPHNSGHATIEACVTSQFEQQVRVLAGLPLGSVELLRPAVMVNLLGDIWFRGGATRPVEPDWAAVLRCPRVALHLYGKREPRVGRKMGHFTCLGGTLEEAVAVAATARAQVEQV